MENKPKFNALAVLSFISGIMVLISLGLYYGLSQFLYVPADGFSFGLLNRLMLVLLELSIPVRNIFAPLAVLAGFFRAERDQEETGDDAEG